MKTITEQFLSGIKWNTIEACLYQGILWGYHVTLFSSFDRAFYGTVGILFSLLYIGVTLCTLGLDSALSPFIRQYTQSKTAFRALLGRQCIPNLITYCGLILFAYGYDINNLLRYLGLSPIDQSMIIILTILLIVESIKKVIKTFLGLLFYNQQLATIEISYIIVYMTTVAGLCYVRVPMTLYVIFLPMLIYSIIIAIILAGFLYRRYHQLPDDSYSADARLIKRITQSRIFGYINQLGHLIFSGNMLVLFAAQLGISYAAVAKIMTTSIQLVSTITQKIIGQASEAAFAHAHAYATHEKQSLFSLANYYAQIVIIGLFAFCCALNHKAIAGHVTSSDIHTNAMILAFSILLLIEPFFMTYEKKYLIEEKGRYLSYYHLTMITLFGLWIYSNCAHPLLCLLILMGVRITWYGTFRMYHLTPNIH
jgi:hypothetical protein